MSDQHATTPEPTPTPVPLLALWALYVKDGSRAGHWLGTPDDDEIHCYPDRDDAECQADDSGESWEVGLIGVSPEWKDKAERAEASASSLVERLVEARREVGRLKAEAERLTAERDKAIDRAAWYLTAIEQEHNYGISDKDALEQIRHEIGMPAVAAHREAAGLDKQGEST